MNSENWTEITLTYRGKRVRGSYKVVGAELTVISGAETKTGRLGVLPAERLAHMLLRELEFERQEKVSRMPREGATIFGDLIGKLDVLRVQCDRCGRDGSYPLQNLISERGRDAKVIDWLDALTAHCPIKKAHNWNDQCAAQCPDLPKGL